LQPCTFETGLTQWIIDEKLRALADTTRRQIITLVWSQERPAGEIASGFGQSRQAISQHLRILLESELVSVREEGTRRLYSANRVSLRQLRAELEAYWDKSLDRLKEEAQAAQRRRRPT
jgi:DNA-binding transcriptional ArsR family regulator